MIKSVELGNFLSHPDSKLELENGVTVFVGQNGAGKSSVIDGITFALFGKHTRKSNKSLIKRGETQAFAKVNFVTNGKEFQVERKIDKKGVLAAKFSERVNGGWSQIAAGERKQFGESTTHEIEKRIGLNFEKLKIASIVQQGELNSIIKAQPKEFKELLNAIIGIDKLDVASDAIKLVNNNFREKIRQEIGYDDTHIEILNRELQNHQTQLLESTPLRNNLVLKREKLQEEVSNLKSELDAEGPKLEKLNQLNLKKEELRRYVKEAILILQREIEEKERKVRDCEECFEYAGSSKNLIITIKKIDSDITDCGKILQQLSAQKVSLMEKISLAKKLQLKDNKCPVCDSHVDRLNPLFQEEHLKQELEKTELKITDSEKQMKISQKKQVELSEKLQKTREAEATLRAHSIKNEGELKQIRQEIKIKKMNVDRVPLAITRGNLVEAAHLDSRSKIIVEGIEQLERETAGFDNSKFEKLKETLLEKENELSTADRQIGEINGRINESENQIKIKQNAIEKLKVAREYVKQLDNIRVNIFNRDGPVATSLRSWALCTISEKASEYLTLLNTKIQRISLNEKKRDITITCYSRNEVLDLESLSGGEMVSVALALRLGMASLLGSSHLNTIILDEPTTHLDANRRKALVSVLSQLSNITNQKTPMQFIIITHDTEIFEDFTVEQIYKFESTSNGSKIVTL